MNEVLELINVSITKKSVNILNEISLTIHKKDIYVLLSNNDGAIDTLVNLLCENASNFSGTIKLFNNSQFTQEKSRMAYVNKKLLLNNLSTKQNINYFIKALGLVSLNQQLVELLEIDINEKIPIKKLSNYKIYKLNFFIALLGNPDFIILDNPFFALDHIECDNLIKIFKKIAITTTLLITSNNFEHTIQVATKYGILYKGKMADEFTPEQLYNSCKRSINIRTTNVEQATVVLHSNGYDFEVFEEDLIRVYADLYKSADLNKLLINNNIDVMEIYISNTNTEEYISNVIGGTSFD